MHCYWQPFIWVCFLLLSHSGILCKNSHRRKYPCQLVRSCDQPRPFSFIWEIKRHHASSPPAYLFGTIHVPYTKVWDSVPQIAKDAFNNSSRIIFEIDLLDVSTSTYLSNCQMLKNGAKLGDILPPKLYIRLKKHLDYVKNKIPVWVEKHHKYNVQPDDWFRLKTDKWERKKPIWITLMLNQILTENAFKSEEIPVLDQHLAISARRHNKEIGSVEKIKDQCKVLNGLNEKEAFFVLNQTLSQHESILQDPMHLEATSNDKLIYHYNCGNLNETIFDQLTSQLPLLKNSTYFLSSEEVQISKQIDDYFHTHMIVNRNIRMKRQIQELLSSNPSESLFFVFGAGHFIGNNSIIELLREDGLQIVHLHDRRFSTGRCNPNRGHIRYPSASRGSPRSGRNEATQRDPTDRAEQESARNLALTISPSRRNSPHEHLSNRQFIFYKPLPIKPVIYGGLATPFSLPSQSYGQNLWPSSHYSPRYLHLVSNSSSRYLSFNDLLVRAHFLNNNLPVTHQIVNKWPYTPAYQHELHLPPSSRTRSSYPWSYSISATCSTTLSAIVYLVALVLTLLLNFLT